MCVIVLTGEPGDEAKYYSALKLVCSHFGSKQFYHSLGNNPGPLIIFSQITSLEFEHCKFTVNKAYHTNSHHMSPQTRLWQRLLLYLV